MPKHRKKHVLVSLATADYLDMAKQFFASAYFNGGWDGDYLLLAHEIPEVELSWFRERCIIIRNCDSLCDAKVGGMHPSLVSKFYMFTPYFKQWQTVIYSDLDAIVRGPLDELKNVKGFCAVEDWSPTLQDQIVNNDDIHERRLNRQECKKIIATVKNRYRLSRRPFCAGFFAFSTDVIRENTFEELNRTIEKYHMISKFGDQLSMNFFFYDRWTKLKPTFNILIRQEFIKFPFGGSNKATTRWGIVEDIDAYIIHIFNPKPWSSRSPYNLEWLSNLKKSEHIDLSCIPKGNVKHLEKIKRIEERIKFREQVYSLIELFGPCKTEVIKIVQYFYRRYIIIRIIKSEVSLKYYFFIDKFNR